eukprot:5196176-Heterocapsa_arctica.AAC.1
MSWTTTGEGRRRAALWAEPRPRAKQWNCPSYGQCCYINGLWHFEHSVVALDVIDILCEMVDGMKLNREESLSAKE